MSPNLLDAVKTKNIYTENGAVSNSTTGSFILDYFAKAGTYRERNITEVYVDVGAMWAESPLLCLKVLFYLRLITRKTKGFVTSNNLQKGQGIRDEFRKGISWVANYYPETLHKNLWLFPLVGSWKDLWHEDLIQVLDRSEVYALIKKGIADEYNAHLIAKYLPKIRSAAQLYNARHQQLNEFAHGLCAYLGWSAKDYRLFKSSGKAHSFQQAMSAGKWDQLNFNTVPGRAMLQLVNNKGRDYLTTIQRHRLSKRFEKWLRKQPSVKFTGYVYELFQLLKKEKASKLQIMTIDKQFDALLEIAKNDANGIKGNVLCALDTSGSMSCLLSDKKTSAYDVCVSLGIYFSALNVGSFNNKVAMFNDRSWILKLRGTFSEKAKQIRNSRIAWGGTNFQSLIDLLVNTRKKHPEIPIEDYPQTLLVVSDMQFNPAETNTDTNYEVAMRRLSEVGLPKVQMIWWWVIGRGSDFPSTIQDEGVAMLGGFDGAIISTILGGEQETVDQLTGEKRKLNAYENMLKALDQEILQQIAL